MKKFFYILHQYLGLLVGLIITIVCLTGAVLAFQDELQEVFHKERYFVSATKTTPLPMDELVRRVEGQLGGNRVVGIQIPNATDRTYVVSLRDGNKAQAYVNPYTGEITGRTERGEGFFGMILGLHRWLLVGKGSIGNDIVSFATMAFSLILLTGIVIWIPKTRKQLKAHLSIKMGASRQRLLTDLHRSMGIYIALGLFVLSLTGPFFTYGWYRSALAGVFGVELKDDHRGKERDLSKGDRHGKGEHAHKHAGEGGRSSAKQEYRQGREHHDSHGGREEESSVDYAVWTKVLPEVMHRNPTYRQISITDGSASVALQSVWGNARAEDKYSFDPHSGEITDVKYYKDQDTAQKFRGWIYSLHTGKWAGKWGKAINCLVALLGSTLPLTGYYLFFKRRRKVPKKKSV